MALSEQDLYPAFRRPCARPAEALLDSPCVKICVYEAGAGLCRGCGRTLEEIAGWTSLSDAERRRIMDELPTRLEKLRKD